MENQKNLFLAIAISMAIIFGFQFIMPQPDPIERSANDTNAETGIDLSQYSKTKKKFCQLLKE